MGQPFQQVVPQQDPNLEVLPAEYQTQQPSTQITINPVAPAPVHAVAPVENVSNKIEYPVLNEKAWDFCQKISRSSLRCLILIQEGTKSLRKLHVLLRPTAKERAHLNLLD